MNIEQQLARLAGDIERGGEGDGASRQRSQRMRRLVEVERRVQPVAREVALALGCAPTLRPVAQGGEGGEEAIVRALEAIFARLLDPSTAVAACAGGR